MSSSHHDDHQSVEVKPVSFSVPFILAAVTLIIIFLFLSLCDPPKHGYHGHEHGYQGAVEADAAIQAEEKAKEHEQHDAAALEAAHKDSVAAPAIAPEVEGKSTEGEAQKHEPAKEEAHH